MQEFVKKRKQVQDFVMACMIEQGASRIQAAGTSTAVCFFSSKDVENLHACINSDIPEQVKKAIVAHDFNGLSQHNEHFLPKSVQFAK